MSIHMYHQQIQPTFMDRYILTFPPMDGPQIQTPNSRPHGNRHRTPPGILEAPPWPGVLGGMTFQLFLV